ncbi:MAG TPA: hypothetical protein VIJ38_17020 [Acidobacteriaceae bacterium]
MHNRWAFRPTSWTQLISELDHSFFDSVMKQIHRGEAESPPPEVGLTDEIAVIPEHRNWSALINLQVRDGVTLCCGMLVKTLKSK